VQQTQTQSTTLLIVCKYYHCVNTDSKMEREIRSTLRSNDKNDDDFKVNLGSHKKKPKRKLEWPVGEPRRWERRYVTVSGMRVKQWTPAGPRNLIPGAQPSMASIQAAQMAIPLATFKALNAPITRSVTKTLGREATMDVDSFVDDMSNDSVSGNAENSVTANRKRKLDEISDDEDDDMEPESKSQKTDV
jgi:hypothetical protein